MINISLPQIKYPTGIEIYNGPSKFNGKRIVVIANCFKESNNPKTGSGVIQTFIIPANESPLTAVTNGTDKTVCNNCKHSSTKNGGMGTCYVNVYQAPHNVYKTWKNGNYEKPNNLNIHAFDGRIIRIGSYGDGLAVPIDVWDTITKNAKGWLGYTHSWKESWSDPYKKYFMASVDTEKEYEQARLMGWRTFRVRKNDEEVFDKEFICPASQEAGHKKTCEKCLACCGIKETQNPLKVASPVIIAHGRGWKIKRFFNIMKRRENKKGWKDLVNL